MPNPLRVLASLIPLTLVACGFHLREQALLPAVLQRIHVEVADSFGPLERDLSKALERSGAVLEDNSGAGVTTLRVPVSAITIDTLSIGASARVREYTMRYHVEFDGVDINGKTVLDKQVIELTRDYTFDETQALGIAAQEEEFKKSLERDMVQSILRRLETRTHVNP